MSRGGVEAGIAPATAVAIVALLAGGSRALADRCAPRAQITGDDAAVSLVASELRRLGVELGAATSVCPAVAAQVRVDGHGGIAITLRDGTRGEDRDVGAPAVAAAWIDAWLRDDLDWRADAAPPAAPARVAAVSDEAPAVQVIAPPIAAPERGVLARASFAAGYEQSWGSDGQAWRGVGAAACVRAGAWCLGTRVRYATQDYATGQTGVARSDLSALATAAYALPIGRLAIVPEVGLGLGRMSTARDESCAPPTAPPCDPTQPNCAPPVPTECANGAGSFVGDDLKAATLTPRGAAALRVEVPLAAHVWLDGIAAAAIAPFGHAGEFDSPRQLPGQAPAQIALPGEPLATFQLGVGLRVGLP